MTTHEEEAAVRAYEMYPPPADVFTGDPVDDWGYEEYARKAYERGYLDGRKAHPSPPSTEGLRAEAGRVDWVARNGSNYPAALSACAAATQRLANVIEWLRGSRPELVIRDTVLRIAEGSEEVLPLVDREP